MLNEKETMQKAIGRFLDKALPENPANRKMCYTDNTKISKRANHIPVVR